MVTVKLTIKNQKPNHSSTIYLNDPMACRFVTIPHGDDVVSIYLLRLDRTPGARGLEGQAYIDAQGHALHVWSGPAVIGNKIHGELIDRLAYGYDATIETIEAEIVARLNASSPPPRKDLDEDLRTGRDAPSTEDPEDDATTPAEVLRTIATENRALTTTLREAVDVVAADLASYAALQPMRDHAKTLREVMAYAVEGYDAIAQALDDLASDLDTPREQLITNLSHAVEILTSAEDARERALATVQALHSAGDISDTAAAAINKALAVDETDA